MSRIHTNMKKYSYDGPVEEFGRCITQRWSSTTWAPSEEKARNNLTFQFKKEFDKMPGTRISLPGKLVEMG